MPDTTYEISVQIQPVQNVTFEVSTPNVFFEQQPTPVIDVQIPGTQGAPGKSAYENWLALGNSGTVSDFMAYLRAGFQPITFNQPTPLSTWVINHNLGYMPQVTVFSLGGVEVEASIAHLSVNQVQVQFSQPFAGSAQLI